MKNIYFTVGPTQLYPMTNQHVLEALQEEIASLSHRSSKFQAMYKSTSENLKKLLSIPVDRHIFFTGSSQESMERIIQNCVEKTSFHIVHGVFGDKFYQTALDYNKQAVKINAPYGEACDLIKLKIPTNAELIAITHNDTSSGVAFPSNEIYCIADSHPDALIAVDLVSSTPGVAIDFSKIDIGFFSIQKGLGQPAGLGVMVVSDRAIEKAAYLKNKGISIGSYHNFLVLAKREKEFQTEETPNVLGIYLLRKVCADMLDYGIEKIEKETIEKAHMLYDFFDTHKEYRPLVKNKPFRSLTTIVIDVKGNSATVVKALAAKGFILGGGYGKYKEDHIRIANYPAHKKSDIKKLLAALKLLV